MKILITGSEGLIGSALTKRLENQNIEVIGFDKKFTEGHPFYGDILNQNLLQLAINECDGIIHLAAVSRVIWGEKNPDLCWKTNYEATVTLLEKSITSDKKPWILYASSREVYGNPSVLPATEKTPHSPINIYGESKAAAENAMLEARDSGLNTAIVRFSNVYGSLNDHHDRVIPAFCKAAATGAPIRVDGSKNTFDFTHIDDVAEGTLKIINLLCAGEKNLPFFHLTTGKQTSLEQAANLANKAGKNQSEIREALPRQYDVPHFCGDSSQTQRILDWTPNIDIEEGIKRLTALFQDLVNEPLWAIYENS
ncbi:MAG: NAD(P)-dependent oxidoreductase [Alphaproteobacteria bacterium]|nr:NAD(P)-dependent oxidoreductase [Alphaproteobacteria bacterium]